MLDPLSEKRKKLTTRKKLIAIMVALFLLIAGIVNLIFHNSMNRMLEEREYDHIRNEYFLAENNLNISVEYLPDMIRDWAFWDYTYEYLNGEYNEFPEHYLNQRRYEAYQLDFIAVLDPAGKAVFEQYYDHETKQYQNSIVDLTQTYRFLSPLTLTHFLQNEAQYISDSAPGGVNGYTIQEGTIIYMSSYPVLRADGSGPCAGSIVFGRVIPAEKISNLIKYPEVHIAMNKKNQIISLNGQNISAAGEMPIVEKTGKNEITAYGEMYDILGNKDLILSVSRPRYLFTEGFSFIVTVQIMIAVFLVIMLGLGILLMEYVFARPLGKLASQVNNLSLETIESSVIPTYKNTEMNMLAESVNNMIQRIKRDSCIIKQNNEDLYYHANFDTLTGLNNRNSTNEILEKMLVSARENRTMVSVYFIDLNRFKFINDTLGHTTGDSFIIAVADRFKRQLPCNPIIGRVGGNKFIIITQGFRERYEVHLYADGILSLFKVPFSVKDVEMHISASLGSSTYPADGQDTETLFKNAEIAMYYAKEMGGNMYCRYETELTSALQRKLFVENKIRSVVNDGCSQFKPYYQPKVSTETGQIIGCEALIRWVTPEGVISPGEFIPMAEESGLIVPMSRWMLKAACQCNKLLAAQGMDASISVNISSQVLLNQDFLGMVREAAEEADIESMKLDIEITEATIVEDIPKVKIVLNALRDMRVTISIDDFGTGYSSLSYLKKLPVDRIKIDRSFIIGLSDSDEDRTIVNAIVAMATKLNMTTTAEGVEDITQALYLRQTGCQELQGYYISKPLPYKEYLDFCANWNPDILFETS